MHLRAQGIDNDDGNIGRLRQARGLSNDDRGVSRGRGIYDAPEGLETTAEAAVSRQRVWGIYDDNRGVGRGR